MHNYKEEKMNIKYLSDYVVQNVLRQKNKIYSLPDDVAIEHIIAGIAVEVDVILDELSKTKKTKKKEIEAL